MFFHSSAAKSRLRAFPFGDQFPAAWERSEPPPDLWLSASHEPLIFLWEWEPERRFLAGAAEPILSKRLQGRKANV